MAIQLRRGSAAAWTAANPVLASGEPGVETPGGKLKFGDGTTAWNSLAYAGPDAGNGVIHFPEDYGAAGNGVADDLTALEDAITAMSTGDTLMLRQGKVYNHTAVWAIAKDGITIAGPGEVRATTPTSSAVKLQGDYITVRDTVFSCPSAVTRGNTLEHQKLVLDTGTVGIKLYDVKVTSSHAGGIFLYGASYVTTWGTHVSGTQADAFHITNGSHHVLSVNHTADWTTSTDIGDDGYAVVSYASNPICHHVDSWNIKVINADAGRGVTIVGGEDIHYHNVDVENTYAAGVYVACEASFLTHGVDRASVTGSVRGAGTLPTPAGKLDLDHGGVLVYSDRSGLSVENVYLDLMLVDTEPTSLTNVRILESGGGTVDNINITATVQGAGPSSDFSSNSAATTYTADVIPPGGVHGWELIGSYTFTGGASVSSGAITIPVRDALQIVVASTGLSGADVPAVRFNGDTGANYNFYGASRAAGGTTLTSTDSTGQTAGKLSGVSSANPRAVTYLVENNGHGWQKGGPISSASQGGAAGEVAAQLWWHNTVDRITSVEVRTFGGALFFRAGTRILIFGRNAS